MKRPLVMLVSAIVGVVITSIVRAAPTEPSGDIGSSDATREPRSAWPAALESKNSVTSKFGSYALSAKRQDLKMYGDEVCILFCIFGTGFAVHSFPIEMQSSSAVAGLEYERRTPWGYSLGGEFLHTEPRYTASLIDPHTGAFTTRADGKLTISHLFVMIKKYFTVTEGFQIFGAAGGGYTQAGLSGAVEERASGASLQLATGLQYRMDRISLKAEYHYVHAPKISLRANDSAPRTGQTFGDLDLSGRGLFVGASVHF